MGVDYTDASPSSDTPKNPHPPTPRYERTYAKSAYAAESYRRGLNAFMSRACRAHRLTMREYRPDDEADDLIETPAPAVAQLELPLSDARPGGGDR